MRPKTKFKLYFPYFLTSIRIILTPIIIIFSLLKKYPIVLFLAIICLLSDFLDTKFSDQMYTTTEKSTKFDIIADKVFEIGALLSLTFSYHYYLLLILEISIIIMNIYHFSKTQKETFFPLGKEKTILLWIFLFTGFLHQAFGHLFFFVNGFYVVVTNLFILYLIQIIIQYKEDIEFASLSELEKNPLHQELMEEDKTLEIKNLKELTRNRY